MLVRKSLDLRFCSSGRSDDRSVRVAKLPNKEPKLIFVRAVLRNSVLIKILVLTFTGYFKVTFVGFF